MEGSTGKVKIQKAKGKKGFTPCTSVPLFLSTYAEASVDTCGVIGNAKIAVKAQKTQRLTAPDLSIEN
jgi:hypothetical protein